MLRVRRHSMIALAPPNGISPYHLVRCGIDDRKDVLILEIDVHLAGDGIVLWHPGFTVETQLGRGSPAVLFLYRRASRSVFETWVSRSSFFPRGPVPFSGAGSLGTKLLPLAQASIKVPSTVKCSSQQRLSRACRNTISSKCCTILPPISRSRFFENTVASHTGLSEFKPTNQRNSRLYSICSINGCSLRIEYSACNSSARSSRSGRNRRTP